MALLEIQNLVVRYPRPGGPPVEALKSVSLQVGAGESLGIVGESGCGKSTLAKAIVGLVKPHSGRIIYDGADVTQRDRAGRIQYCRQVQMVFQDAIGSLNPRMTVAAMLGEVLRVHGGRWTVDGGRWMVDGGRMTEDGGRRTDDGGQRTEDGRRRMEDGRLDTDIVKCFAESVVDSPSTLLLPPSTGCRLPSTGINHLLEQVGLPPEVADAYPRELSGGQCQRVSLARCLALEPRVLVADEPVSALDVSVQARVLNLLRELQQRLNLALLLVSHDLAVVRTVCDHVCVLQDGVIVEQGSVTDVLERPTHAYTRELLAAVPDVDRALARRAGQ